MGIEEVFAFFKKLREIGDRPASYDDPQSATDILWECLRAMDEEVEQQRLDRAARVEMEIDRAVREASR